MVLSVYIVSYINWLRNVLLSQGINTQEDLYYVPDGSLESMISFWVRKAMGDRPIPLVNNPLPSTSELPPEPYNTYLGFNRGVLKKSPTLRQMNATRGGSSGVSSRKMTRGSFDLEVFIVSNSQEIIEDVEEIYSTIVMPYSKIRVETMPVFEIEDPEFCINTIHNDISSNYFEKSKGNLFGINIPIMITCPVFNLTQSEKVKAKKLSITLYSRNVIPSEDYFMKKEIYSRTQP